MSRFQVISGSKLTKLELIKSTYYSLVEHHAKRYSRILVATIGDKIVETLYLKRVTSENKRIRTPPLSPPFKVGVFVVFYR